MAEAWDIAVEPPRAGLGGRGSRPRILLHSWGTSSGRVSPAEVARATFRAPASTRTFPMSTSTAATTAAQEVWQRLGALDPRDAADVPASLATAWIDAASGEDPRARAAVFEAFQNAVADGLKRRAAMVTRHD
jgi:hypothetical protein